MNIEQYESAWRSTTPPPMHREDISVLMQKLARSARGKHIVMSICAFNAIAAMALTVYVLLFRRPVDGAELASALLLQTFLTVAVVVLRRRQQKRRDALRAATLSVRDSAEAAFASVTGEMRDIGLLFWAAAAVLPMLALCVWQLMSSGKMTTKAALSFGLVCVVIIAGNAAIQWRRYHHSLAPQRERLETFVNAMKEEA
ncbi:MAG TPA: hypothetical protein VER03_23815 [Bryobacteraceae bacterium]|nr:hypothetical protein [Bryobacteraceae bacterium]